MTKIKISLIAIAAIFLSYDVSSAQDSFSEIDPGNIPQNIIAPDNGAENTVENVVVNGVEFFDNEEDFGSLCGTLATEDFEDTNLGPNSVMGCEGAFNSLTNNGCYSPGALISGFSMFASGVGSEQMAVLTPNILGVTNVAVGPNSFADNTNITFNPPVTAASMILTAPLNGGTLDVDVFGPGDIFLGSLPVTIPTSNEGTFLGIATPSQITRITLDGDGETLGELFYELSFGQCRGLASNVPTLSEWGLILMAAALGLVGFMVIRRKKVTA